MVALNVQSATLERLETAAAIHDTIVETIGWTPLVRLHSVAREVVCDLVAKVELLNPGGSVKDRIGAAIIEDAEQHGKLRPGGTIVEATSGNTGVGLAIAAAMRGYKCVFVLPDKQSIEKIKLLRAYGARVIVTPTNVAPDDPRSYYSVAKQVVQETPNAILANQYHNPINPETHYRTTGPEIWQQTAGKIDAFVGGMGTGGTISGVGRYLKEQNPHIQIIGVDPEGSILADYFKTHHMTEAHSYKIEGIGEDFIPSTLDFNVIDNVIKVTDKESFLMARRLTREEGIFCGGSAGSAVAGALRYAMQQQLGSNKLVVVLLPDSGYRYLGKIFDDEWMRENRFLESAAVSVQVHDVLSRTLSRELITAAVNSEVGEVIAKMKAYAVSQLPVLDPDGQLTGLVTEVSLLNYLLNDQTGQATKQSIDALGVIERNPATVMLDTPLETVLHVLTTNAVAVIIDPSGRERECHPIGILSKIDLLSYLTAKV